MSEPSASPPARILIVDDDPIVRSLMSATLQVDGHEVIEAEDGDEACEICEKRQPDLLVADVVMPRMDGFALCSELRRRPQAAYLPILMATGLDDIPSITKAYEVGATDFISKPINWIILGYRVRYLLRANRAFEEVRQSRDQLAVAKEEAEAANRAKTEFLANMGRRAAQRRQMPSLASRKSCARAPSVRLRQNTSNTRPLSLKAERTS